MRYGRERLFIQHPELEKRRNALQIAQQKLWQARDSQTVMTALEQDTLEKDWEILQTQCDKAQDAIASKHVEYKQADKKCENCQGTGGYKSKYNPDAKWDWYQIGGRWSGEFAVDYDPTTDPKNIGECEVCAGTGQNTTTKNSCTYCKGIGTALKWPTQWADTDGNVAPVSQVQGQPKMYPYAIVLPTGEWIEKGQMGWFGMSNDKVTKDEWETAVETIFDEYPDHLIVAVDCHI
jgi:hypothetical protein